MVDSRRKSRLLLSLLSYVDVEDNKQYRSKVDNALDGDMV